MAVNKRRRGTLGPSGAARSRYLLRQQMISEGAAEDAAVVAVVLTAARGGAATRLAQPLRMVSAWAEAIHARAS